MFQADTVSGAPPVPADFQIAKGTRVLVITGPNTGGKTICLKSVGLAAMMAKSGKAISYLIVFVCEFNTTPNDLQFAL